MDSLATTLVVQVESIGEQYISARLLPPWKSHVVGRHWKEVEARLRVRATRELRRAAPHKWLMNDLLSVLPTQFQVVVEIAPPGRNRRVIVGSETLQPPGVKLAWKDAKEVSLDAFRWDLPDGMSLVKVPALRCEAFGNATDVSMEVIEDQVRVALVRLGDRFDLWQLRQKFFNRAYSFQTITIDVDLRRDPSSTQKDAAAKERRQTVTLRSTASDLTGAELEPVYGRDAQVTEIAEYLVGQSPQSVLIVGPAGVGKTALVHRLVQMSQSLGLAGRKVWSTTGSRLVSGMSGLGMWQERCLKLIKEAHATGAILHVGSIIELMEAGKIDGQPGVASMIRQAIGRGRIVVIAECTPEQLALVEREEPLLLRSMVRYDLPEPSAGQITSILRQAAEYRTQQAARKPALRSSFAEPALEELYRLHRRYATYSAMPAQPLRLMQTILERSPPATVINAADVARAFASQTGLPRFLVDDSINIDLDRIRQRLSSHVIGQTEPVDLVVNLIATLKTRLVRPGRPLASLLFIGPTGVGKTEMAKALAGLLYSDTRRMIRIDMSEYASPWAAVRLIGRPDEGDGTLTSPIREQPFSVVLLDEFEKADPTVFDMLLQLLGEGRLTDSLGRLADFRNAVVIMTSNLGVESFRSSGFGFGESGSDWRAHFQREVERFVRPELLGRIDRIVPFAPLPRDVVRQIAQRELELLKERPGLKYRDIQLEFSPEVIDHVSEIGYVPKYGARPLRRAIEQQVAVPLASSLAQLDVGQPWKITATVRDGKVETQFERRNPDRDVVRQSAEMAIDTWQRVGRMARMAMTCSPLRDLENETQRLQRINDSLFEKLKSTTQTRRVNHLKDEIQRNAVTIERNRRIIQNLQDASQAILREQADVMLNWYRNEKIEQPRLFELPEQLQSDLRSAVVGLLEGRAKRGMEVVSVLILGRPIDGAAVLWQTYEKIAQENQWKIDRYSLKPYEAGRDRSTPEYRKRFAQKRSDDNKGDSAAMEPSMRLLSRPANSPADSNATVKSCDVYSESSSQAWLSAGKSVVGVALQLTGANVSAWLGNEHGIMHFIDSNANNTGGARRRTRYRVMVQTGRLVDVVLPNNWMEAVGSAERDPRRTFSLNEGLIVDGLTDTQATCGQTSMLECLATLIRQDREQLLWQAIDFTGIPPNATLRGNAIEVLI